MSAAARSVPTGLGTAYGPMPGTDPAEAVRIVTGETDFGFVPELPARGVGADSAGRAGAILIDMPFERVHSEYRLSSRPSAEMRLARDLLARDLDAVEERWDADGFIDTGRLLKVQVCGPFTYSATVELRSGHKIVRDRGARLDVVASMTDGLAEHVRELRRRLGAEIVVQLDEPKLRSVLDGSVPPLTRLDAIPPVPVSLVAQRLEEMAAALDVPMILHGGPAPESELWPLLSSYAMTVDLTRPVADDDKDRLAEFLDGGGVLLAGLVPAVAPPVAPDAEELANTLAAFVDELGVGRSVLREIVVTVADGLAEASPSWAATALGLASRTAEVAVELAG